MHDPTDPVGRLLFNVLAMIAEFESDLIRMRTREGMKVAKAKGRLRGKQPKLKPAQEAVLRRPFHRVPRRPARRRAHAVLCTRGVMDELLIARNPDPDSRLPFLMRLPLAGGMVFRTSRTWPRTKALYCYPLATEDWPEDPDIIERSPIRSCTRRGAAIELVLDRGRENRSQLVFTKARGCDAVFWQSPRTRKQARPNVPTPTARAAGVTELQIIIDTREQYAYRFANQQVNALKWALRCGDYCLTLDARLVAVLERTSLADLVSSLLNGKLRYALGEPRRAASRRSCR